MNRSRIVIKNTVFEMGYYLIVIALGFLAPRYIILTYGSSVNGLSTTITQILNVILILQAGATTAAVYELFKPIAEKDYEEISRCIFSAKSFFKKVAFVFLAIMLVVSFVSTKYIDDNEIESIYILFAFILMGLKSFFDLLFTSKHRIIFTADQSKYILSIMTLVEQIVYYALVFLTIFLKLHFLCMYIAFLLSCIVKIVGLEVKYRKKYANLPVYRGGKARGIKGRSYSLANEVAHSTVTSSITIIMSFMYNLEETSVYSIYTLISSALHLVSTAIYSSFAPTFGNVVAAKEKDNSFRVFCIFQYVYIIFNVFLISCMLFLSVPFVRLYTNGVTDINYADFVLAGLVSLQSLFSVFRIPYNVVVSSCGLFKETWVQPVVCSVLSIGVSLVLGRLNYAFILVGPIFFYFANFMYQHIRLKKLVPHLISNKVFAYLGIGMFMLLGAYLFGGYSMILDGWIVWIIGASVCALICFSLLLLLSCLIARKELKMSFNYFMELLKRK